MMLTSVSLKSQKNSVKGREVSSWEAGREMSVADGWLAGCWKHDESSYTLRTPNIANPDNCLKAWGSVQTLELLRGL